MRAITATFRPATLRAVGLTIVGYTAMLALAVAYGISMVGGGLMILGHATSAEGLIIGVLALFGLGRVKAFIDSLAGRVMPLSSALYYHRHGMAWPRRKVAEPAE